MYANPLAIPPIAAGIKRRVVTFDFRRQLAAGVTIASVSAINVTAHSSSDGNPASRKIGDYSLGALPIPAP